MRIVVAGPPSYPMPPIIGGAMSRIWNGLSHELASLGHTVTVVSRSTIEQNTRQTIGNVEYIRCGGFDQSTSVIKDTFRDLLNSLRIQRKIPPCDALITNSISLPIVAAYNPRVRTVVINVNRFPKRHFFLYRKASRICVPSQAVRDAVFKLCPKMVEKTILIPNPIDTDRFAPPPRKNASETSPNCSKTLLFVGRVHPEKGVLELVRAFASMRHIHETWRLKIVGPTETQQGGGGNVYLERILGAIENAPVELTPPIYDEMLLSKVYQESDLFCYPSLAEAGESFGVAPLEAMACGVPVILSDLRCFSEFMEHGKHGWVFRRTDGESAIVDAISQAISSPESVHFRRHCRESALRFSYPSIAQKYDEVFRTLLRT